MEVIGKKLLVLGGSKLMEVIVNKAKSLGIYTIVTDNRPLSAAPVKLLADEYHDIDFSNYGEIKRLIGERGIDGVMTGFSDADLEKYLQISPNTKDKNSVEEMIAQSKEYIEKDAVEGENKQ